MGEQSANFGAKILEDDLFGKFRLGVVESIDTRSSRCSISYSDGIGGGASVVCNPSPYYGFMPMVGAVVGVYDKPGWEKRMLFPVSELVDPSIRSIDTQLEEGEDIPGLVSASMSPGDCVIGRNAKVYVKNAGDIIAHSALHRAKLELKDKVGKARLSGVDFELFTPGKGIRMFTKRSVPTTYGDEFLIEKNIPSASQPDTSPEIPQTNITRLQIDKAGTFTVDAATGGTKSSLSMDILGNNSFGNLLAKLSIDADLDINLSNPLGSLDIEKTGDISLKTTAAAVAPATSGVEQGIIKVKIDGDLSMSNLAAYFNIEPNGTIVAEGPVASIGMAELGDIILSNGVTDMALGVDGHFLVDAPSASIHLDTAGQATISGTNAEIDGDAQTLLRGALIKLGAVAAGHAALAEPIAAIITALNAFNTIVKTHTHIVSVTGVQSGASNAPGVAAPSLELGLAPVPPAATAATVGSTTVEVQS